MTTHQQQAAAFVTQTEFQRLEGEVGRIRDHYHKLASQMTPVINLSSTMESLQTTVGDLAKIVRSLELTMAEQRGGWKMVAALGSLTGASSAILVAVAKAKLFGG